MLPLLAWRAALAVLLAAGATAQARPDGGDGGAPAAGKLAADGARWLQQDDLLQARDAFRRLRALAPDDPAGVLGLGETYLKLGETALALAYARSACARWPDAPRAVALHVRALLWARQFERAVQAAGEAVATLPRLDADLLAAHASALFRVQRTEEAAAAYRAVLGRDPRHAEAHVRLGSGLGSGDAPRTDALEEAVKALHRDELERAAVLLEGVLAHHEGHPIAHRLLGETLLRLEARQGMAARSAAFQQLWAALPQPELTRLQAHRFLPGLPGLDPARTAAATRALALFSSYLPKLITMGGQHDLLDELERTTDAPSRMSLRGKRTFDGRIWDDVRGIGGLRAATGIEALDEAVAFGFDTLSHEIAHQAHLYGFGAADRRRVRKLFQAAQTGDHFLDYYAANNEAEYFGQGVEAFASYAKRPGREPTHGHTRFELQRVDRALHDFLAEAVDFDPLRDPAVRARILPLAVEVALASGRPQDAVVAAEMLGEGAVREKLLVRARRAVVLSRSY